MPEKRGDHFQGKSALEHLREARKKGSKATEATHGVEMPGYFSAGCDSARESALYLLLLFFLLPSLPFSFFAIFTAALLLWKTGRAALLGWQRLGRLHRLIEEERWEIEHHRGQEREELAEMYRAKGFEGKLLEEVLDVLMADDNRLLQVMLEEELGAPTESYEHPLEQALGAAVGVFVSGAIFLTSLLTPFSFLPAIATSLLIGISAYLSAKREGNEPIPSVAWHLGTAGLATGALLLLLRMLSGGL